MTEDRHALFSERYASGETPWDSGITPPEIVELLADIAGGQQRLDLGCGSRHRDPRSCSGAAGALTASTSCGKPSTSQASKLSGFPQPIAYRLFCHDVTRLDDLPALQ